MRYHTLDGMRGVAALAVASFHFSSGLLPSSPLAVDLFFMISGFVLALVYEPRFAKGLGTLGFLKLRLIRLYPLYFLAIAFAIAFYGADALSPPSRFSPGTLSIAAGFNLLMLPSPTWWDVKELYPLNLAAWSLFFELVANVAFAALWPLLRTRVLVGIAVTFAVILLLMGGIPDGSIWPNFAEGFVRIGFAFTVGVIACRCKRPRKTTAFSWALPFLLFPVFALPTYGPSQLACVLVLFPLLVWFGASIEPQSTKVFSFLGTTSYPVYVFHLPTIWVLQAIASRFGVDERLLVIAAVLPFLFGCYAIAITYDEKVRAWLKRVAVGRSLPTASVSEPT